MLQILNPYYKSAVEKKAEQHAAALDAWLKTQTSKQYITIADLKAAFPAIAGELNRELVNEVTARLSLLVVNPDDTEA